MGNISQVAWVVLIVASPADLKLFASADSFDHISGKDNPQQTAISCPSLVSLLAGGMHRHRPLSPAPDLSPSDFSMHLFYPVVVIAFFRLVTSEEPQTEWCCAVSTFPFCKTMIRKGPALSRMHPQWAIALLFNMVIGAANALAGENDTSLTSVATGVWHVPQSHILSLSPTHGLPLLPPHLGLARVNYSSRCDPVVLILVSLFASQDCCILPGRNDDPEAGEPPIPPPPCTG